MLNWFRRKRPPQTNSPVSQLRGVPPTMRTKTHLAATGYVYLYLYKGHHDILDNGPAQEFVFEATRDRKQHFLITVQLQQKELALCCQAIERDLLDAERYAIAKLTLLEAFDEKSTIAEFTNPLAPSAADMTRYLNDLGRI